ncbi:hypothetical protein EX30DRAFT_394521 [Ascodesmis nigricans]|uniref:Uncharacterized protein n=1 Tax=Ascodesmis nigricans TaxID=341454 RepID=A0A4S2N2B6_9PEZI|nr:hypothetical protein EX30DRAFT_394521 [Ascodesmis nigricans]
MCGVDCFLVILAFLFPPLPVWVKRGICSADSFINIALCCLGFLPGLIHAVWIISRYPDPYDHEYEPIADESGGRRYQDHRPPLAACHQSQNHGGGYRAQSRYMVYTIPAPQEEGYGSFANQRQGAERTQDRYVRHQQQTPPEGHIAGPSVGAGQGQGAPPSYASVVAGDHKIQH